MKITQGLGIVCVRSAEHLLTNTEYWVLYFEPKTIHAVETHLLTCYKVPGHFISMECNCLCFWDAKCIEFNDYLQKEPHLALLSLFINVWSIVLIGMLGLLMRFHYSVQALILPNTRVFDLSNILFNPAGENDCHFQSIHDQPCRIFISGT